MNDQDTYGSKFRDDLKHSMSKPFTPLNVRLRQRQRNDRLLTALIVALTFVGGWMLLHWGLQ